MMIKRVKGRIPSDTILLFNIHLYQINKKRIGSLLSSLLLLGFLGGGAQIVYADDTLTDNFTNGLQSWVGDVTYYSSGNIKRMQISPSGTASKTFYFNASYKDATTTITFDLILNNEWENSGGSKDFIDVYINNVLVATYSEAANYSGTKTITTGFANGSGDVPISIKTRNTANNEYAYIDNVSVTVHTPSASGGGGCDSSLDTSANDSSPGVVITAMNNITTNTTACISGASQNGDSDYYYFTVNAPGTLDITTSSPNSHDYHLKIGSTPGGNEYYGDTTAQSHNVSTITLSAGDSVYLYVKETGSNTDEYEINFNFVHVPVTTTAVDDSFSTSIDTPKDGNVKSNDSGTLITVTSHTNPSNGTLVIAPNGDFTYTPNSSYTGTDTFTYTITDSAGNTDSATVTITISSVTASKLRDFQLRNNQKLFGDVTVLGNTVLCVLSNNKKECVEPSTNNSNADTDLQFAPESYATLELPVGATVTKAYLYWQGRFDATSSNTPLTADQQASASSIQLKTPKTGFVSLTNGTLDHYTTESVNWVPIYSARKDVTGLVQTGGAGKYYVQGLTTTTGATYDKSRSDGLGAFGAWTLVVVYEDPAARSSNSLKDVSIFDGYKIVQTTPSADKSIQIDVSGFYTPPGTVPVTSTLYLFAGEGDKYISGDSLEMNSTTHPAFTEIGYTSGGTSNAFYSGISTTGTRSPSLTNNNGIDIQKYNVGTETGGLGIIGNSALAASFKLSTTQDTYMPSVLVFSTDLYTPNICYSEEIIINGVAQSGQGIELNENDNINVRTWFTNTNPEVAEKVQIVHTFDDKFTYVEESSSVNNNNPAYPAGIIPPPATVTLTSQTDAANDDLLYYDPATLEFKYNLGDTADANSGGFFYESNQTTAVFEFQGTVKSVDANYTIKYEAAYVADYGNFKLDFSLPGKRLAVPPCVGEGNSFYARPVSTPIGGMDAVDVYDYPGSTGAEYTGGSTANTNGNGPGPDLTTKVAGETTTFDVVYLGDGTSGPVGFHPSDASAIAMPVLLYLYELNTTTNAYDKVGPLIDTNGKIAHASLEPGAVSATSVLLSIPNSAKRNVKIGMHYFDMNGNSAAGSRNCYIHSSTNSNLQDVPACLNNENNIEAIFGAATKARCTALWTMDNGNGQNPNTYGPCTSSYGAAGTGGNTPIQAPYDVEPMCLSCLLDNSNAAISVDSFAIRPKDFVLNATVVQSDNAAIVLDQSGAHPVSGPNKLRSGEDYNLSVTARNFANAQTMGYDQSTNQLNPTTVHLLSSLAPDTSNLCADVNVTYGTVTQFVDGFDPFYMIHYNEVGVIDIDLNDTDWAAIDSDDTPTTATYTHFAGGTRYGSSIKGTLRLTVKPYDFNITSANVFDNNNPSGFTYLSNDINMTARLPITVNARNKSGGITQNYSDATQGLYEQLANFTFTLDPTSYPSVLTLVPYLPVNADLPFNSGIAVINETDDNVTRFNFNRNTSVPVNPFKIEGTDVNLSITDADDVRGDANGTFIGDATFVYGRVHMPRVRAMCSGSPCAGNMTFFFEFYGDKDANTTLITNLVGTPAPRSLDSVNWYRNTAHNTNVGDGNVTSSTTNIPGTVTYTINGGSTSSAIYNYSGTQGYPFKGTINVNDTNNTQTWLIYDKYNAAANQVHGELEFYGPGEWSSTTGAESTIQDKNDTTRNKNTNRRIRW